MAGLNDGDRIVRCTIVRGEILYGILPGRAVRIRQVPRLTLFFPCGLQERKLLRLAVGIFHEERVLLYGELDRRIHFHARGFRSNLLRFVDLIASVYFKSEDLPFRRLPVLHRSFRDGKIDQLALNPIERCSREQTSGEQKQ